MAVSDYANFELTLRPRAEGGYLVEAASLGGQASELIAVWPFKGSDITELRQAIDGPARDARQTGQILGAKPDYEAKVRNFGEALFDTVFCGKIRSNLEASLALAEQKGLIGLRLRLHLEHAPEVADYPWEYLYKDGAYLSPYTETPIVRYLPVAKPPPTLTTPLPLRVLVMIADPVDMQRLDVEREWRTLDAGFNELQAQGLMSLERVPKATRLGLPTQLQHHDYHVFHFIGHGGFEESGNGGGFLYFEDPSSGKAEKITAQDLELALNHPTLRLAVLNSCEGAQASARDPFAGVAHHLRKRIPATVAMQSRITDKAAIRFAESFYGALAKAFPIDRALVEARKAMLLEGHRVEFGTPVLFMRPDDGRIFDLPPEEERRRLRIDALKSDVKAAIDRIDTKDYQGAVTKLEAIQKLLEG